MPARAKGRHGASFVQDIFSRWAADQPAGRSRRHHGRARSAARANGAPVRSLLRGSYSPLTSDRPLVMTNGISGPGKHLGMPIGPRLLFIAADDRDEVEQLEDDSLFARLTTVGSGKGNGAEFPLVSPLAANLKKYHAESDVSLFPLIMGTYAPTAVRKMFGEMFANPPKDATPDHLREAVELCAAASRGY
jgi:hypothetical protein